MLFRSEALNRLSDPSAARRKAAANGLAEALHDRTPIMALVMNTLAFEKQVEDRWRKYDYPAQSRHIGNEVDAEAVDALPARLRKRLDETLEDEELVPDLRGLAERAGVPVRDVPRTTGRIAPSIE